MDWYLAFGFFLMGFVVASIYWGSKYIKADSTSDWQEKENAFKEELLGYHRDNLVVLNVRNVLTEELIKAIRELK